MRCYNHHLFVSNLKALVGFSLYISLIPPSSFSEVNPNAFLTHPLRHIPLTIHQFNHGMRIQTYNLYNIYYVVL